MIARGISLTTVLLACATTASAQLISIRTVPVSQSHQFDLFPSSTMAMGSVSIAVPDSLRDPFSNPATGARVRTTRFFGSPSVYSVSGDAGAGRTLPLGTLTRNGAWFGGLWFAVQQVEPSERAQTGPIFCVDFCPLRAVTIDRIQAKRSHTNTYGFATVGRQLDDRGLSIGGSMLWSRLNAVDGVDLLYAGSAAIEQFGHAFDARVGVLKEWPGDRSLEAVAVHNRFGTTHDVYYLDMFWDPGIQQFSTRERLEKNLDRTNTWGLHLAYQQPVSRDGWHMGGLVTANRMDHPKIPNYEIMNIPRDPGNSSAFNVGVGIARRLHDATFGMDIIYEPIWSHTWADAEGPLETASGGTIPKGGMTIENRFRFSNALFRAGVDQRLDVGETTTAAVQLGLNVRSIHYWLDQQDHVQLTKRDLEESWTEWTPTWGLTLGLPAFEIRYRGSVTHGTGRPGVRDNNFAVRDVAAQSSSILVAPSGPLTLSEVRVTTHQISLSLPLR